MLRASRQTHLVVIAVLLVSAFLFFHASWDNVETRSGVVRKGKVVQRPVHDIETTGKGKEAEKHGAPEVVEKPTLHNEDVKKDAKKGVKQVVIGASSTTLSAIPTSTPGSISEHILSTTKPLPRSSASIPPASASSAFPLIINHDPSKITPTYDRAIVVGKLQREDVNWVGDKLPDWQRAIYTTDSPASGQLHTLINKGHEAMPFLTYIIEHYDKLPNTIVFARSQRAHFLRPYHDEGEESDVVELVRTMDIEFVQRVGYANLRCGDVIGYEKEKSQDPADDHSVVDKALAKAWPELFHSDVPTKIGGPCSSEFAVSRQQIRARPLADYYHYLDWLIRTPLDDDISGGVFECSWHVIFGREPVYCPEENKCFCDLYRRC